MDIQNVIDFNKYDKTRYGIFLHKERDSNRKH
jgi:hypothetical protein